MATNETLRNALIGLGRLGAQIGVRALSKAGGSVMKDVGHVLAKNGGKIREVGQAFEDFIKDDEVDGDDAGSKR